MKSYCSLSFKNKIFNKNKIIITVNLLITMKKFFTFFSAFLLSLNVFAQVPQKMSYQAVIRNNSNSLVISSAVGMRISIIQATITGTPVYVERQTTITNANGLVSIEIGSGTALTGTFAGIDWSAGPYFIKTETDPVGGTNYSITGTSQLLSVPYALYASTASKIASQKNINGVSFDGSADITVSAASNTLTGTTLAPNVVNSSLTSVGTITSGTWSGATIGSNVGGAGNVNGILKANGSGIVNSAVAGTDYLSPTGSAALLTNFPILNQSTTGNAATATKLLSTKNINGIAFDGSADITVSAASNTLTGTTLAPNIVNSSLASVGTITSGTWNGGTIGSNVGGAGNVNGILKANGSGIVNSAVSGTDYLSPTGSAALLTNFPILNQSTTGNAATATKILSTKNINGIAFDGSADITVAVDSNTLTGTTLASNVVNSSLTSVGTITSGTWNGATIAVANGGTGTTNGSITGSTGLSFTAGGTNQNVSLNPSGSGKVVLNGNVGIGTSSPNTSAALDVSSTSQMFYPPRMTTAQRDLISSPSTGGVIYNTTLNKLQVYTASSLNTDGTGYYSNSAVYDDPFQGQTIQPLYSGPLSSIKANVSIRGASDYIQVKIYDAPNGNLLATSDTTFYAPLGAGTFNFVTGTWTFTNSNLIFNANSTYYIEFNAIGGNRFFIGETNNTYSRGQLYKGSSHVGVTAFSSYDIDCAVSYGNPGAWDANVTATKLNTSRNINGVAFDGSSDITVAAASNTLTGTTLASNVVNSSLTSVGTITNGTWNGTTIDVSKGGTGLTNVGSNGQVLTSNGSTLNWSNPLPSAVYGVLSSSPSSITLNSSGSASGIYTGATITLPKGKWAVNIVMLANCHDISSCTTGLWWLRFGFSTSPTLNIDATVSTPSTEFPINKLVSGATVPNNYGIVQGTIVINNTTGANKTYYLWTSNFDLSGGNGSSTITNIASSGNGENLIIAYPMY
jgi:hypothetical protein